jgi:RNA polymerase sigma-70 factor (ECF subfamily)
MDHPDQDRPLNEIETLWSDILRAHQGEAEAHDARVRLVLRYIGAVRRYIAWVLRDGDAAAELAQEFAVRVLRGDFRRADPSRGRFRDLVRAAALNLVHDYYRRRKARPSTGSAETPEPVAPPVESDEPDADFLRSWRMELFSRAMAALAVYQERTGRPYHDVISLRTSNPRLTSNEMAALISARSGKPVGDVWVRQTLRRARGCLADLLLDEVAASLGNASVEQLEQELIILDMLGYCHDSLRRRARRTGGPDPS